MTKVNHYPNFTQRLPFIIGISGHRDASRLDQQPKSDTAHIKQAVTECLIYWRKVLGAETPIWLLTGFAEGADLLAVDAVQALHKERPESWSTDSVRIIPCLPMPLENYKLDFSEPPKMGAYGRKNFLDFVGLYEDDILVVPSGLSESDYQAALQDSGFGEKRSTLYLNQGYFIAKYCNVLLAIWDGKEADGLGGTGDVVAYKCGLPSTKFVDGLHTSLASQSAFDGQVGGLVQHILVERETERNTIKQEQHLAPFTAHEKQAEAPFPLYIYVNQQNENNLIQALLTQEFATLESQLKQYNQDSLYCKVPELSDGESGLQDGLASLWQAYKRADESAKQFQKKYRYHLQWFWFMAFIGLLSYEVMSSVINDGRGVFLNLVILFCVAICHCLIQRQNKKQFKWKYQLCRSVAEALRVKSYLNLADVAPDAKHLLPRRYRHKLPLVNHAANVAEIHWWYPNKKVDAEKVKEEWLKGQVTFIEKRITSDKENCFKSAFHIRSLLYERPRQALLCLEKISSVFFKVAIAAGSVLLVLQGLHVAEEHFFCSYLSSWFLMGVQISLLFGAVAALWQELANYKLTIKGYEDIKGLYERALFLFDSGQSEQVKEMLRELAHEAMEEHAEWHHFERQSDLGNR